MKISGMMNVSKGIEYCYPFIEAITSFLPVCDEIVVVVDPYSHDGTEELIRKTFDEKVRVVSMPFDLEHWGRISWGLQKTAGYLACRGDCVLMFDADGILHEKDIEKTKEATAKFMAQTERPVAHWTKYRFYGPKNYFFQPKHYGIFNKKFLGDKLDFFDNTKGAVSLRRFTDDEPSMRMMFGVTLFGYEHTFDTPPIYEKKLWEYGKMLDRAQKLDRQLGDFVERQIKQARERMARTNKSMEIEQHPKVIQERLRSLTSGQYGFNYFYLMDKYV